MAQLFLVFLIISHIFAIVVMATEPSVGGVAPTPSIAEAPIIRRLGKHRNKHSILSFSSSEPPHLSPIDLPQTKHGHADSNEESNSSNHQDLAMAPMAENGEENHRHHRGSFDKSVAGGGVILGGLATTFLVAIFCYIRATRRSSLKPQHSSP